MAIIMRMDWDGITPAQYDELRGLVNWEGEPPVGGIAHVAGFTETGLRVNDIWESAAAFETFVQQRLQPGVDKLGIESQPRVEITEAHAVFIPATG
jgi:hypothetical protein